MPPHEPQVETVLGPVPVGLLGTILPHEHFPLSRAVREEAEPVAGYLLELERLEREVIREVQPYGVSTFVEVTPVGLTRAVPMMQRLSRQTGLHVVASTGFYLEGKRPEWVRERSVEELADFMMSELTNGIAGAGVKAWMIKVAASGPLESDEDAKVFRAAALASRATGAAITTHSCNHTRRHFDFLVEAGADPSRVYIGHADLDIPGDGHLHILRGGGHLIFTCWGIQHFVDRDLLAEHVVDLCRAGHARQVLLSIDYALIVGDNRMDVISTEYECPRRTPAFLFRYALPKLREKGLEEDTIRLLIEENPRQMLVRPEAASVRAKASTPPGRRQAEACPINTAAPPAKVRSGLEAKPFGPDTEANAVHLINGYIAGWPYCRPVDAGLLDHWRTLGSAFQPEHMLIAYRDGVPRAFLHGERDREVHFVNLLALAPGAVDEGEWLLQRAEEQARAEGAARLCALTCRKWYGGYVLGLEPYHPHWAVEVTDALVRAGFAMSQCEALMVADMAREVPVFGTPAGYEIADAEADEEFRARAFRLVARWEGEEVAICGGRLYPELPAPRGGMIGQLGFVGTAEAHRGKGLATCLVSRALARLRRWGAAEVLISTGLENAAALRAYEKAGFRRRHNQNEWQKSLR